MPAQQHAADRRQRAGDEEGEQRRLLQSRLERWNGQQHDAERGDQVAGTLELRRSAERTTLGRPVDTGERGSLCHAIVTAWSRERSLPRFTPQNAPPHRSGEVVPAGRTLLMPRGGKLLAALAADVALEPDLVGRDDLPGVGDRERGALVVEVLDESDLVAIHGAAQVGLAEDRKTRLNSSH